MKIECYSEDFICSTGNVDSRKHVVKPSHDANFRNTICVIDNDKNLIESGFPTVREALAFCYSNSGFDPIKNRLEEGYTLSTQL